jgi:hypothetical protein
MRQKLCRNFSRFLSSSTKKPTDPIVFSTPAIHSYREKKELTTNFEIPLTLNQQAQQRTEEPVKKTISEIQFSVPAVGKTKAKFQPEQIQVKDLNNSSPDSTEMPLSASAGSVTMAEPLTIEERMKGKLSNPSSSFKGQHNAQNKYNFSHLLFGMGFGVALGSLMTFLLLRNRLIEVEAGAVSLNDKESKEGPVGTLPRWLQFPSQAKN